MKTFNRLYRGALLVSLLTAAIPLAVADEKGQASRAVLAESDRLQVLEIRQKPGEVTTPSTSATRVVRALQGGTMLRTYADGKTEKVEWKTGEVQLQEPGPQYTVKNVGNSEIVLYVVRLK
ncbi:hypothetical protein [Dechloromonas sp. H13]|uniref:hypothetical protein n=1 Tax=Dechloromonas sp. H13 TaxID=2570193 RepID=UPI001290A660|nr:hypothetical protein [Dechloromonas sp. H13]